MDVMHKIFVTCLIALGTSCFAVPAQAGESRGTPCSTACFGARDGGSHANSILDMGVARIAAQAATPDGSAGSLTQRDWLSLFLLFSLQPQTQAGNS